ncbi:MAG: hypothetical protein ACLPPF_03120, partial [Rhodomicrobium sp.]
SLGQSPPNGGGFKHRFLALNANAEQSPAAHIIAFSHGLGRKRSAGFLAIPCALNRLRDPNAVLFEKANTIPPLTRNGPRAAVAEVQKSRIMHRTVTNSFARGEELNQQFYAGYDTREDPDVEIFTRERSRADIPSASSGDSHAALGSRFCQAIQPTTVDSVATISGGTPCPYSPWRVTVASAANVTVQPSAEPHSRVRACASRTAVVSSSDPVTKWNQCGYPHLSYSS